MLERKNATHAVTVVERMPGGQRARCACRCWRGGAALKGQSDVRVRDARARVCQAIDALTTYTAVPLCYDHCPFPELPV